MLRRYPVFTFYLAVFALTLLGTWAAFFVFQGSIWAQWIAGFSPALAAVFLTGLLDGKAGVAGLLARLLRWKVHWKWYLAIFLLPVALSLGWAFLNALVDGQDLPAAYDSMVRLFQALWSGAPGLLVMTPLMALLIAGEELGWRGFALERLLKTRGPLVSSLIVGFLWGIWHLPEILDPASVLNKASLLYSIPLFVLGTVVYSFIYTWLWQNTGGSLLVVCLFHSFYDLLDYFTAAIFPAFYMRYWLYLLATAIVLLLVWAFSRARTAPVPVTP
jgi:membrane protease YdiL (CAAX protease family)